MISYDELKDILSKSELFNLFLEEDFNILIPLFKFKEYNGSEVIFRDGDFGDKYYIILQGEVRISKEIPRIGEETLVVLKKGACFGEMALINEAPRSATAIANTSLKLCYIDRDAFDEIIYFHKDQGYKLLLAFTRILGERLKETDDKLAAFLSLSLSYGGPVNDPKQK